MIKIRKFKADDENKCLEIINKAVSKLTDYYSIEEIKAHISERKKGYSMIDNVKKGRLYLVAIKNKEIVGVGALDKDMIKTVYINPTHQNRGVGEKIMIELEKIAQRKGIKKMKIHATLNSVDFYKKFGYKKTGITKYCNGKLEWKAIVMEKNISKK
ncbi:GNAT family N-acetyltransferase [Candidatus Woesearchaeota archaeon]|nr:GNAT family N-acetyltransferase [Candidatus Woesearchaeota archaeon]